MTSKSTEVNGTALDLAAVMSKVDNGDGEFMPICHPATGDELLGEDGKPMGLYLLGRDSEMYRKSQRSITNRRLQTKGAVKLTAERLEAEANEILAKCTVGITDNIILNKQKLEFNFQNIKMLYDTQPWIKDQVDEFVAERANFLGV